MENRYFSTVVTPSTIELDTQFGGNGIVTTDIGITEQALTMQLDTENEYIYLGGYTNTSSGKPDFALVRYTYNGILDTSFGPINSDV
jgi:hypothetical protein